MLVSGARFVNIHHNVEQFEPDKDGKQLASLGDRDLTIGVQSVISQAQVDNRLCFPAWPCMSTLPRTRKILLEFSEYPDRNYILSS